MGYVERVPVTETWGGREFTYLSEIQRCECGEQGEGRYSLGIYAGIYCDQHWETSGYRKEGKEGYDYLDAGELYDEDY